METEGIRYSGSKKTLIDKILSIIPKDCESVLDGCSGTTRVSQALKKSGYSVGCNDISEYSKVFGECYIKNNNLDYVDLLEHLNNVTPIYGWLTDNYGGVFGTTSPDGKKKNWTIENTQKADGIREEIEKLSGDEKSVALTSLILALDKVSNNLGHQVAYLRDWAERCDTPIVLKSPWLIYGDKEYKVYQQDIETFSDSYDCVYLDIPYGTDNEKHTTTRVRYSSYYHIWTSICKWDKPELFGASNRRKDSSDKVPGALSQFEKLSYDTVLSSIERTCRNLNTDCIIFSYNNKSKVKIDDLIDLFGTIGKCTYLMLPYKENVQKKLTSNNNYSKDEKQNYEYLFKIEK